MQKKKTTDKYQDGGKPKKRIILAETPTTIEKSVDLVSIDNKKYPLGTFSASIMKEGRDKLWEEVMKLKERKGITYGGYEDGDEVADVFFGATNNNKTLSELTKIVKDTYGIDISKEEGIIDAYKRATGYPGVIKHGFDKYDVKETITETKDDTFIKEAKKAARLSKENGVPAEVIPIYGKEQFEQFKAKYGKGALKGADIVILGHSSDKQMFGVPNSELNNFLRDNMDSSNICYGGTCMGPKVAASMPDVPNMYVNMGEPWIGVPDYNSYAGRDFNETFFGNTEVFNGQDEWATAKPIRAKYGTDYTNFRKDPVAILSENAGVVNTPRPQQNIQPLPTLQTNVTRMKQGGKTTKKCKDGCKADMFQNGGITDYLDQILGTVNQGNPFTTKNETASLAGYDAWLKENGYTSFWNKANKQKEYTDYIASNKSFNEQIPLAQNLSGLFELNNLEREELANKKDTLADYSTSISTYAPQGFAQQGGGVSKVEPTTLEQLIDMLDVPQKLMMEKIIGEYKKPSELMTGKELGSKLIGKDNYGLVADLILDPLNIVPLSKVKYLKVKGLEGLQKVPLSVLQKIGNIIWGADKVNDAEGVKDNILNKYENVIKTENGGEIFTENTKNQMPSLQAILAGLPKEMKAKDKQKVAANAQLELQQILGYKDNSPFKNLPSIDIYSDTIDMNNVSTPLKATSNNGISKILQPNSGLHYFAGADVVREVPMAQDGGGTTQRDSIEHQANKILKYEILKGGPNGAPLPYYSDPKYKKILMDEVLPEINKIMPNASAIEKAEAMDFIFNAGFDKDKKLITKDPRAYALQEYYRKYDESKLDKDGKWSGRKNPAYSFQEEYDNTIGKLPENERRVLLNLGRDWYYKNINNPAPGVVSPDYAATWYGRIHNTNDYKEFDPKNPKFSPPNKMQQGGGPRQMIFNLFKQKPMSKYVDGGFSHRAPSYQFNLPVGNKTKVSGFLPLESLIPIQTEKKELIVLPTFDVVPVNAKQRHSQMTDDQVTDIVPENSYILSQFGQVDIYRSEADEVIIETENKPYNLYGVNPEPRVKTLGDIMNKKVMKPADLGRALTTKYKQIDNAGDPYTQQTNMANKETLSKYLQALIGLSEMDKARKGIDNSIETQMGQGQLPQMVAANGGTVMRSSNVPKAQLGLAVGAGASLLTGAFNYFSNRSAQKKVAQNQAASLAEIAKWRNQQLGLSNTGLGIGMASVFAQDPTVDPVLQQSGFLDSMQKGLPQQFLDYQQSRNLANRPDFSGLGAQESNALNTQYYSQTLNSQSALALQAARDRAAMFNKYLEAKGQIQNFNIASRTNATNATRVNANNMISTAGGIGMGNITDRQNIETNALQSQLAARGQATSGLIQLNSNLAQSLTNSAALGLQVYNSITANQPAVNQNNVQPRSTDQYQDQNPYGFNGTQGYGMSNYTSNPYDFTANAAPTGAGPLYSQNNPSDCILGRNIRTGLPC